MELKRPPFFQLQKKSHFDPAEKSIVLRSTMTIDFSYRRNDFKSKLWTLLIPFSNPDLNYIQPEMTIRVNCGHYLFPFQTLICTKFIPK